MSALGRTSVIVDDRYEVARRPSFRSQLLHRPLLAFFFVVQAIKHSEQRMNKKMATLTLNRKLAVLADAAKYDASCASSGSEKRNSAGTKGIGSTEGSGICHSYAPDGRCISLLKILLTNFCVYDCIYCVNRSSSNVARARFSVEEVVRLTLDLDRKST